MKREEREQASYNSAQIYELSQQHPFVRECWGWGARLAGGPKEPCLVCGILGDLHYEDGTRCWRCAFWHHAPSCPHVAEFAK